AVCGRIEARRRSQICTRRTRASRVQSNLLRTTKARAAGTSGMSPRDTYWFIAGAASGLMVGALSVYFLVSSSTAGTAMPAKDAVTQTNTPSAPATSDPDVLMPGDRWPTQADVNSTGSGNASAGSTDAGSLETVTRNLAERLETKGG